MATTVAQSLAFPTGGTAAFFVCVAAGLLFENVLFEPAVAVPE